jgi:hypothetical protein
MSKISIDEIIAKIPALKIYAANPDIVKQLYDELNPKRNLSELVEGDFVNGADVLIVRVLGNSSYIGCPVCYTKQGNVAEGVSFECPNAKCGNQRVATKLVKWTLLAGDENTKAVLDFPPFAFKIDDGAKYLAKVVNIRGKVTGMREERSNGTVKTKTPVIMVREMKVISDIRDEPEPERLETTSRTAMTNNVFNPPTPAVSTTPASILPEAKIKAFSLWMSFQTTPVTEAQLTTYLTNNLKATLPDVLPLLDVSFVDSQNTNIYSLKK